MARVAYLFRAPKRHLAMEEIQSAEAVVDFGFLNCAHARRNGIRQVLLVDKETLDAIEGELFGVGAQWTSCCGLT